MAQVTGLDPIVDHHSSGPKQFLLHHHPAVKSSLPHRRRRQAPLQAICAVHRHADDRPMMKPPPPTSSASPASPSTSSSAFTVRARCCHMLPCLAALQHVGNVGGKSATSTVGWHVASIAMPTTDQASIDHAVNATVANRICYSIAFATVIICCL
ncbi:hypothetical protein ACLOJK_019868 [Asimina triloba]